MDGDNVILQKCNVKNLSCQKTDRDTGAAGIAYMVEDNSSISDCNVEQLSISGGGNIAGILSIGTIVDINQCTVNKFNINSSGVHGVSGIVYCLNTNSNINKSNISNCKVNNLDIKCDFVERTVTGIIGRSERNTKISNCNVSNVSANIKNLSYGASGIVFCTGNDSKMNNCIVNNFNIISTQGGTTFSGIMATPASYDYGENISITGCSVNKMHIEAPTAKTGGIAYVLGNGTIISKCEVQNITVKCNNAELIAGVIGLGKDISVNDCNVDGLNVDAQEASVYDIAGIVSVINSGELNNCDVNNMNVNCKSCDKASGILCSGYQLKSPIENCNVSNLIITVKANTNSLAGISGIAYSSDNSIIDCNVKNMEIHHNSSNNSNQLNLGGITVVAPTIESCTVNELKVESPEHVYFGGISVFNSTLINKCKSINLNLNAPKIGIGGGIAACVGTVKNCDVDGFEMSKITSTNSYDGIIGGIVGCLDTYNKADEQLIDNCTVKNSEINGLHHTGGIVGNTSYDITNCSVESTNLTGNTNIGGIVGMYTGKKCEGNTVTNCDIETTTSGVGGIVGHGSNSSSTTIVNDCDVIGTTIKGVNEVGGISGACAVNITNCNVEGGNITGTGEYIGGIQGTGGDLRAETAPYYPSTITNCKVKGTTITGGTDVGDIQGKDSYYLSTDGTMTPSGRDTITGCSREP